MKHKNLRWNPVTGEWVCAKCGRTSDHVSLPDAEEQLDQHECTMQSVGSTRSAPGTETTRLRKVYKMAMKTERSGCRFGAQTDEGKPIIRLDLFHNTVSGMRSVSVGFELLTGTTPEQARALVDSMNERIIGVIVTPK